MTKLYQITTIEGAGSAIFGTYNVLASTAQEAIQKLTSKLNVGVQEMIEEIKVLGIVNVE